MAKRRPPELVQGSYTALPHRLLDSPAFMGAGHVARSLLFDLLRQHTGSNNGHIQATNAWLKKRGWNSVDTLATAKAELIERGLIVQTKQGGLNIGPSRFALTWLSISNFVGLDIRQQSYQQGAWLLMDGVALTKKRKTRTVQRSGAVPPNGTAPCLTAPLDGPKTALFSTPTVPLNGNNECLPIQPTISGKVIRQPVVGKKGKSGMPLKKRPQKNQTAPVRTYRES